MKIFYPFFFALFKIAFLQFFLGFFYTIQAQFTTPTINGNIGASEYGNHTAGQNAGDNWYMTWDNTNLYIAIESANIAEASVIYLSKNPLTPINSGTNTNGTNVGFLYDNTNFAELPFRANLAIYVKNSYREYRTADGSNAWSAQTTGFGAYSDNGSNVREFSIAWSVIGGLPSSFAWFGYVTNSGGFAYNQTPIQNLSGNFGTSGRNERYFSINNTANGSSTKPFARNCFVFNRTSDWDGNAGSNNDIQCWDFTMNTADRTITRRTIGGFKNWDIAGNFILNNGIIDFSAPDYSIIGTVAQTTIGQDLIISGGTLNINQNREVLTVQNLIMSGGTLTLATNATPSAGIALSGNWTRSGGTFTPNNKDVIFNGTSNLQTLQRTTGAENFYNLTVNKNNNILLQMLSNATISNRLRITQGDLDLNNFDIDLLTAGFLEEDIFNGHLVKDNTAIDDFTKGGKLIANTRSVNTTSTNISGLGITLLDNTPYTVDIWRRHYRGGQAGIRRIYNLVGTPTSTELKILYSEEEIPSPIMESHGFYVYRWSASTGWQTMLDSFHDQVNNRCDKITPINQFSAWTLGSRFIALANNTLFLEGILDKNFQNKPLANLKWTVNPEQKTVGYELQQSEDGTNFYPVLFKDIQNNTQNNGQNNQNIAQKIYTQTYSQTAEQAYYRIKQVYQDQSFIYSNIVFLQNIDTEFVLYPNPSQENIFVKMPNTWENDVFSLKISNISGQEINTFEEKGKNIAQKLQQLLPKLSNSIYLLQIKNNNIGKKFVVKWIVKNE